MHNKKNNDNNNSNNSNNNLRNRYLEETNDHVTVSDGRPTSLNFWLHPVAPSPEQFLVHAIDRLKDAEHRQNLSLIEPVQFEHQSHEELTATLKAYAVKYANITRLYSIGKSVRGKELWVMEISDNPGRHEPG